MLETLQVLAQQLRTTKIFAPILPKNVVFCSRIVSMYTINKVLVMGISHFWVPLQKNAIN